VPYLRISWGVIIYSTVLIWAFFVVVVGLVVKAQRRKPQSGLEGLIGMTCEACEDFDITGKVFVHGEYWNARSVTPIKKGEHATITAVKGIELTVERIADYKH
jgi:membrane-bound serine protease (ClpP class)